MNLTYMTYYYCADYLDYFADFAEKGIKNTKDMAHLVRFVEQTYFDIDVENGMKYICAYRVKNEDGRWFHYAGVFVFHDDDFVHLLDDDLADDYFIDFDLNSVDMEFLNFGFCGRLIK